MSLTGFTKSLVLRVRASFEKRALLRDAAPEEIRPEDRIESLRDPNTFYRKCFRYFHTRLIVDLRRHRAYFQRHCRGFGEDAFHVMWFLLFREFKPRTFLEIGVYRGQTLSLAAILQQRFACEGEIAGISPFTSSGDSVSTYQQDVDYFRDTLENFARFSQRKPRLLKAFSTDAVALELISAREWDCIYIDGNHDYAVAKADWEHCASAVKQNGIIVLDDSAITTSFDPPAFASKGHAGPSRVAQEIDTARFREILQVGHNRAFQKIS